jgi:hypothetical protein
MPCRRGMASLRDQRRRRWGKRGPCLPRDDRSVTGGAVATERPAHGDALRWSATSQHGARSGQRDDPISVDACPVLVVQGENEEPNGTRRVALWVLSAAPVAGVADTARACPPMFEELVPAARAASKRAGALGLWGRGPHDAHGRQLGRCLQSSFTGGVTSPAITPSVRQL